MTIDQLAAIHERGLLNMSALARLIGVDPRTLINKINRRSPELSVVESEAIERALSDVLSPAISELRFRSARPNEASLRAIRQSREGGGTTFATFDAFKAYVEDL